MLKNKLLFVGFLLLIFIYLLVLKTNSFFLSSAKGQPVELKTGQWHPAQSELVIIKDGDAYSIKENIDSNNSNNPYQTFNTSENQYLSFQYKINSGENAEGFDEPNFLIRLNAKVVFQDTTKNDVWKRAFINLKNHKPNDNNYLLEFFSSDTFDEINSPNMNLKEISTSKFLAKKNDILKFSVSKPNAKIHLKYSTEDYGVVVPKEQVLSFPYEFPIIENFYDNKIEYFSVDSFNNVEDSKFASIYTDFIPPEKITDAEYFAEGDSQLSVTFSSSKDNFSNILSFYELKMSIDNIINNSSFNWNSLENISLNNHKKFGISSLPSNSVIQENILGSVERQGLIFVAIKSVDQAGNYSDISNIGEVSIY